MSAPVTVAGARVGVVGLARSGTAVARLLAERGARVYASDAADRPAVRASAERLEPLGIEVEIGGHDLRRLAGCDWLVASPGIPPGAPVLTDPAVSSRPIFSELEVASWFADAPVVAITGTNGKTTTTTLLGTLARAGGLDVSVSGNIGRPFSAAVREEGAVDWHVLEVSSFQLARIATFRPRVAVVLNLAADHLDVYASLAAYAADKRRIAENQTTGDDLCLDAEDPAVAAFGEGSVAALHWFHRHAPVPRGATVEEGWIVLVDEPGAGRVLPVERLGIPGAHNLQNALAATVAASRMGIARAAIAEGLATFAGVPHRLETVMEEGGVRWVNDSKATNVASTAVALDAFDAPLVVILGGRHKGTSYDRLATRLAERARRVLAIGEAADLVVADLGDAVRVERVGTLERAVERAREIAREGDVVLLSPACSSYDQFANYEERGERFRGLVHRQPAGREAGR